MIGDWQVISEKPVGENQDQPLNIGVRKRKVDEEEEEALAAGEIITKKKGWGQTYKKFPGSKGGADMDLDALFTMKKKTVKNEPGVKEEPPAMKEEPPKINEESEVKAEDAEGDLQDIPALDVVKGKVETEADAPLKADPEAPEARVETSVNAQEASAVPVPTVVFKKRKRPGR